MFFLVHWLCLDMLNRTFFVSFCQVWWFIEWENYFLNKNTSNEHKQKRLVEKQIRANLQKSENFKLPQKRELVSRAHNLCKLLESRWTQRKRETNIETYRLIAHRRFDRHSAIDTEIDRKRQSWIMMWQKRRWPVKGE